jgi:hypothetical protein
MRGQSLLTWNPDAAALRAAFANAELPAHLFIAVMLK